MARMRSIIGRDQRLDPLGRLTRTPAMARCQAEAEAADFTPRLVERGVSDSGPQPFPPGALSRMHPPNDVSPLHQLGIRLGGHLPGVQIGEATDHWAGYATRVPHPDIVVIQALLGGGRVTQ